ncbi:hypothetical protein OE88DRAFT_1780189 [Heliocybe sulcata]|uniref:Transcription factor domain-containing protein n=1 Tax=Heliocybe sulcata TaxID=5364 RepID=A0A5C3NFC9_9AGAM|nr:hypothetical protein OE88DRAFT_1780189 [Heliocybe sulcata]
MSPKSDASSSSRRASSASPPYPPHPARRASNKPKSARQQFSACGACRMRRSLASRDSIQRAPTAENGVSNACTFIASSSFYANTFKLRFSLLILVHLSRSFNSFMSTLSRSRDEFAQVKAVKLLRRGRRLQQVEAVYGKVQQGDSQDMNLLAGSSIAVSHTPLCYIPKLKPEFFSSRFFRAFSVQRPILDPTEFTSRYFEYTKGNPDALGAAGQIIAMVLVVWAASFGIDEAGNPTESESPLSTGPPSGSSTALTSGHASDRSSASPERASGSGYHDPSVDDNPVAHSTEQRYESIRRRKGKTNEMLREILRLIDVCGILRKPTWDGVRVLLLVLPLTADMQPLMERLTMYESTLSQIYTLCSLSSTTSAQTGQGEYIDALVRARIFWYAYAHEGITTGLKGGRLYLSEDDLNAFQATLPPLPLPPHSPSSAPHSPTMPSPPPLTRPSLTYSVHYHYGAIPLRVSGACRLVHAALTGPRARQRGDIDEIRLKEAWDTLDSAYEELESLKSPTTTMGVMSRDEVLRFVYGWQIHIFEIHNVIREALKQRLVSLSSSSPGSRHPGYPSPSSLQYERAVRLHPMATQKCHVLVRTIVQIIRNNLGTSFFEYDAGIVRDGCFFAGFMMAGEGVGSDEDVGVCLRALEEMQWGLCKSEEREQNVRLVWEGRARTGGLPSAQQLFDSSRVAYGSPPQSSYGSPPFAAYGSGLAALPGIQEMSSMPLSPGHRLRQSSATSADGSWPIPPSTRSETSSPRPGSSHSAFLSSSSAALGGPPVSLQDGSSMSIPRSTSYYSRSGDITGQGHQLYYGSNDMNQYSYAASSSSSTLLSARSLTSHQASVLASSASSAPATSSGPLSAGVYQTQSRYFDPASAYSSSGTSYPSETWQ